MRNNYIILYLYNIMPLKKSRKSYQNKRTRKSKKIVTRKTYKKNI